MCGRVVCALDTDSLIKIARANGMRNQIRYSPSYNVPPTRYIGAICRKSTSKDCECENLNQEENKINSFKGSNKKNSHSESENSEIKSDHITKDNTLADNKLNAIIIKNDNELNLKTIENNDNEDTNTNFNISNGKEPELHNELTKSPEEKSEARSTSHACVINHEIESITSHDLITNKAEEALPQENESNTSAPFSKYSFDLEAMKWGTRTKDNHFVINARSETLHITSFKNFKRCVLIIEGYFEWKQESKASQPYYIHNKCCDYMLLAGLYRDTYDKDGFAEKEMVIVTKSAIKQIEFIHHRMPIILTEEQIDDYLLKEVQLDEILRKQSDSLTYDKAVTLNFYPVGDLVNKLGNHGKDNLLHKEEIKYDKNKNLKLSNFFGKKGEETVFKTEDSDNKKNNIISNEEKRNKKLSLNDLHSVEKINAKKEYDTKTNSNFDEDTTTQASNNNSNNFLGTNRKENKSNLKNYRKRKNSSISEKVELSSKMKKNKSEVKNFNQKENVNKISPHKNFNTKIMEIFLKTSTKTNSEKEFQKY